MEDLGYSPVCSSCGRITFRSSGLCTKCGNGYESGFEE